jgi:hypothetical protein
MPVRPMGSSIQSHLHTLKMASPTAESVLCSAGLCTLALLSVAAMNLRRVISASCTSVGSDNAPGVWFWMS